MIKYLVKKNLKYTNKIGGLLKNMLQKLSRKRYLYVMNKSKKLFYIGEANDLISRFSSGKYKNKWEYYRYDKLPMN